MLSMISYAEENGIKKGEKIGRKERRISIRGTYEYSFKE